MNVSSVMNTYNMNSLWNNINPNGASNSSSVPLIDNINSSIEESYLKDNYFGQNASAELQDVFQKVQPNYGIPLTYDTSGNLSVPSNTTSPSNGLTSENTNIISLLQSGESSTDLFDTNILYQYNDIENGIYRAAASSILSSNPNDMYNNISSLQGNQEQNTGNYLDSTV